MLLLVFVVLVGLFPGGGGSLPVEAQGGLPWRDKGSPFGIEAALGNRVRSDEIPAAVSLMREAGVQWQREEIFWDKVQKAPDAPFIWTGDGSGFYNYDRAIEAQVSAGIRVVGLLDYNPAWYKGQNPPIDAWIDDWGNFVYAAVARYGRDLGWIKHWELWNEPNVAHFGHGGGLNHPVDFVRILEVGRAAAKAADPEATIIMGGIACISDAPEPNYDCFDYLDRVGKIGGWNHVDIIGLHIYQAEAPENPFYRYGRSQNVRAELQHLDSLLLRYGVKPVWITEIGWSTNTVWPGVDVYSQAFYLVRAYLLAIAHPSVEKIFWYDFRNDTWPDAPYNRPAYDDTFVEFHFGLLNRTYPLNPNRADLRKPSFLAFRTMTDMLGGLTLRNILSNGENGIYWYRFEGVGRKVDVLWRTLDTSPTSFDMLCGCGEAMVRNWKGELQEIIHTDHGSITFYVDTVGAPTYIEYNPPVSKEGGDFFHETGHSLRGAFRAFWHSHNGREVFGLPLTEEMIEPEPGSGRPRVVQYFERARFIHYPELGGPQLSRVGEWSLVQQGIDWFTLPRVEGEPPEECLFFEQTGHTVCSPFRETWERYGGLSVPGYPLSQPQGATHPETGEPYMVQYFERARLEFFPERPGGPVEAGLVGRELFVRQQQR
jgi:hypothetical protein